MTTALEPLLIDRLEAAALLGISVRYLDTLTKERRIPFVRMGRLMKFDPDALREWVRSHAKASGKES